MESSASMSRPPEIIKVKNRSIIDENLAEVSASVHSVGHDSWQQVGLMVATCFNGGTILTFSNLMLMPLGWSLGIACLFLVGLFTWYTGWLLAGFHFIDGQRFIRYKDMIRYLFGKHVYYAAWISQSAILILGNMGFILLGGRALKEINLVFSDSALRLQYFIIITGFTCFVFSFGVPNMSSIRLWLRASTILTFGYIGVVLVIVVKDGKSNSHRNYEVKGSTKDKVFNAFGAISATIVSNAPIILPEIQATLRKPAVKNMRRVLTVQFTAAITVYYGVGILGYWAYGSDVSDYLPTVLSGPKWAKVLINLMVFLLNVITQHVFLQPIHEALDTKFLRHDEGIYSKGNLTRRFFLRLLLLSACTLVAAALPFIGYFINLMGSFPLILLTFILPSMIFLKVKGKTAPVAQKAWHWTIIFVSSLLAVVTTASAFRLIVLSIKNCNFFCRSAKYILPPSTLTAFFEMYL